MDPLAQRLENMTPLQRAVYALKETQARLEALQRQRNEPIAVIGMACRFPGGANDPEAFWRLLCDRIDAIRETPPDRWNAEAFYDPDPHAPGKMNTRWGGFLDRIDQFDNHFFGISDREAARIDPQQRLLLELAWEGLEDAGLPPASLRGSKTGVFVGISLSDFAMILCNDLAQTDSHVATGTSLCLAANRVSFAFGFQGPSVALDTACSSSLVAVHLACQQIRSGECEAALAGGASLLLSPIGMVNLTKAGFSASDGRVRAFDAAGTGYVRGEGAGLVVLKPLSAALKDKDPIRAVILGSAVNQNGESNGLTAPSRAAQEQVLRAAYAKAGISPGQVQYVEAQGTGTRLGDAIEAMALGSVLREGRAPGSRCRIGSVKTNVGHLEAASGVVSVMKATLALEHRQFPPSLHFRTPNPDIPFDDLPLAVQQALEPWPETSEKRLAGVSAFGFGGSNAHLVLQEAPATEPQAAIESTARRCLLPLSARTDGALTDLAGRYVEFLRSRPAPWRDVCYTAAERRDHHDCRLAVLADSPEQAVEMLSAFLRHETGPEVFLGRKPFRRDLKVALVYDGSPQAWQPHLAFLADLVGRMAGGVEEIDAALQRAIGLPLADALKDRGIWGDSTRVRPVLLALQLALTAWWRSAGVAPESVLGRCVGELAAACTARILTVEQAMRIAAAGPDAMAALQGIEPRAASLPFISSVDGQAHRGSDLGIFHWQSCLRHADGWAAAVATVGERQPDVWLKVGPGSLGAADSLGGPHPSRSSDTREGEAPAEPAACVHPTTSISSAARQEPRPPERIVPTLRAAADGKTDVLTAVGTLYAAGADIVWARAAPTEGRCVRVPTYPWQRQRLWALRSRWLSASAGDAAAGDDSAAAEERRERPELTAPYVAPRTDLEREIARSWSEVLGIDAIGIHDSFFELGGDSLQVTVLLNRLQERLDVVLPLRDMYETPTIARLAERIDAAASEGGSLGRDRIPRVSRDGVLLPSFTQEALWFLDQLERDRPTYTIHSPLRIRGPLNIASVERALHEIARRHESLRTRFPEIGGRPVQVIDPAEPRPLPLVDLSRLPASEQQDEVRRWIVEEMGRPIDLQTGPLIRITLLRLAAEEHVAVVSTHHIIYDGWSMGVLLAELGTLYEAFEQGRPSPLAELPIQYADFAAWQRERLQGEHLERLQGYWVKQLAGVPPLELPTDHPRPAVRSTRGGALSVELSRNTSEALHDFCRREGVTPFMALLAALEVLLHRYSGQDDFAIGSPVANRSRAETESLIGYFVNVVVLRSNLSGGPSFREVLRRVRDVTVAAYEHQELTLDRVVGAVNPPRDLSRHPLFQVMFALQNFEVAVTKRAGVSIERLEGGPETPASFFDLTLEVWPVGPSFRADWYYNTDLFGEATLERMAGHFEAVLAAALAEPDRPVAALPLLSDAQQRQLVVAWNDTAQDYPRDVCFHSLFEARARRTPDTPAVVLDDRRWTYHELDERAGRLAKLLRKQGVGPEVRVGICLERSPELVMAVLGVLKAGGAYVPLDPGYVRGAEERIRYVLDDARVSLVVTDSRLAGAIDESRTLLLLDGEADERIAAESGEDLEPLATADNLAYVLYTSGSTGRPKGVMVTHRNLVNAYFGWEREYRLGTEVHSHLQMASFGFDVFTGDLVRALGSGGKLVICRKETLLEPAALLGLMHREEVEAAEFVPVVLRNFIQYLDETGQRPESLRLAIVGSDAWFAADHRRARRVLGEGTRLVNSYGLTETTIDSSYFEGDTDALPDAVLVPIGRPFPNVRLYVLDERMQPVPIGVSGELYIGGDGVSRGYVDATLDAARFVVDPFALTLTLSQRERGLGESAARSRLCRTGDRARWRADGQVEFLGRADDQVKIRGFRVEPGEVEQVLREHPAVANAAVVARPRTAGDVRLVAYVAAKADATLDEQGLRQFVAQRVPDYMVPSALVTLDAIPTTSSGKIDRRSLPEPDWNRSSLLGEFVAPRTAAEEQLASIWRDVLNTDRVGVHDDFFDLGGNSLLALRLAVRIREAFSVDLPLIQVFSRPTVAGLAEAVAEIREGTDGEADGQGRTAGGTGRAEFAAELVTYFLQPAQIELERMAKGPSSGHRTSLWKCLVPLRSDGEASPLFCIHGLGGHVATFLPLARALAVPRPVYGLQGLGLDPGQQPHDYIEAMAECYMHEIREVQPDGPYLLCGWSMGGLIALETAHQLAAVGGETALVAMLDSHLSTTDYEALDLTDESVLRWIAPHVGLSAGELKKLPLDRQWEEIARRANLAQGIGVAEIRRLAEVCKAHLAAAARYRPQAYPGRTVLFRAGGVRGPLDRRWQSLCPRLEVESVSGSHYSMLRKPHVDLLAERLDSYLNNIP